MACTPPTPSAGEHTHITLSPSFLPGVYIHSWPPQGFGGSPPLLSQLRLDGSPGLQGGISEDGQLREDPAGDAPKTPLADVETPPQELQTCDKEWGEGTIPELMWLRLFF